MKDKVISIVEIKFNLWERIKLLFGGSLRLRVESETENVVGRIGCSETIVEWVGLKPKSRRSKGSVVAYSDDVCERAPLPPHLKTLLSFRERREIQDRES